MSYGVPWRQEISERLVELHEMGLTFGEIARRLNAEFDAGLTRNSCIGRARRMNLPERPMPVHLRTPKLKPHIPIAIVMTPTDEPKSLLELERNECRFPFGEMFDRPPYLFCGRAIWKVSWCKEHYKKVYHPAREKWA